MQLRHYQETSVRKAIEFFKSGDKTRPALVAPTGSGKSVMIAYIAKELEGNILILQPSAELAIQNFSKYEAVAKDNGFEPPAFFSASIGIKERAKVTFATIGSIYRRPDEFQDVRFVIIDECHTVPPVCDSMYMQFLNQLNVKVIGLTATPYRLKTYTNPFNKREKFSKINLLNRERPSFFNRFLHIIQIQDLYVEGFLCPLNYVELSWDGQLLKSNSNGAEYTETSMKQAMDQNSVARNVPAIVKQGFEKGRTACVVFTCSVDEAAQMSAITPHSAYLYAEMPKPERRAIIEAFKGGGIKTVFNVGILQIGFDFPKLDTIIIARPTMSLALFSQMVGRGMRLAEGKNHCTVVDMCGNLQRFGKPEYIELLNDEKEGWILRNQGKTISGVRLDEL